jgi:hypothetical protein
MSIQKCNGEPFHYMSYQERESLKRFARECARNGDIESLERSLIMISHFMRQEQPVPFSEYAAQWVAARTPGSTLTATESMGSQWPLSGMRRIADGGTDFRKLGSSYPNQRDGNAEPLMELIRDNPGSTEEDLLRLGACFVIGSQYQRSVRRQLRALLTQGWLTCMLVEGTRNTLCYYINEQWWKAQ